MPKLTDSQLVILSAAAQRDGGTALPLPKSLKFKAAAVTRMLNGLRQQGLLEEKPAPHDAITWREGKGGERMMLVITAAGLKALDDESAGETSRRSQPTKPRAKKARAETKAADAHGRNRKQPTSRAEVASTRSGARRLPS